MTRQCPVPLCGVTVQRGHLMCRSCWGAVPAEARRAVNRTWRKLRTSLAGRSPTLRADVAAHRAASDVAIAAAQRARP